MNSGSFLVMDRFPEFDTARVLSEVSQADWVPTIPDASQEKHEVLCSLCLVHDAGGWTSDASCAHRSQGGTESVGNRQVHSQAAATP